MNLKIRPANESDWEWVNARYREVNFQLSRFEKEFVAIAECDDVKAGLGRIVRYSSETEELGGMYVIPDFRRQGIAEAIVRFLVENRNPEALLFCLPFKPVAHLYEGLGFRAAKKNERVPEEIYKKFYWCNETYPQETSLYIYEKALSN